ncbi:MULTISPECIES: MerR family transcriptional regulator [unclassified Streptomyces]|uniref:MerR family transcriptional regulator n=1 Tax=unclassified Streptomyces TaxID=2593676 RepID=UPI002E2C9431|nr:MerR family transcriptional regulator [Streptomyces sp. NBC_01429]
MRIGELSRRTGVTRRLLRYYEEQELIHPERLANGYRDYPDRAVEDVLRIRDLLRSGLPTRVIRDVLPCPHGPGDTLTNPDLLRALVAELGAMESRIACLAMNRDAIRGYLRQQGVQV